MWNEAIEAAAGVLLTERDKGNEWDQEEGCGDYHLLDSMRTEVLELKRAEECDTLMWQGGAGEGLRPRSKTDRRGYGRTDWQPDKGLTVKDRNELMGVEVMRRELDAAREEGI